MAKLSKGQARLRLVLLIGIPVGFVFATVGAIFGPQPMSAYIYFAAVFGSLAYVGIQNHVSGVARKLLPKERRRFRANYCVIIGFWVIIAYMVLGPKPLNILLAMALSVLTFVGLELYFAARTLIVRPQPFGQALAWTAGYIALLAYAIFAGVRGDTRAALDAGGASVVVFLYYYGAYRGKISDVVTSKQFKAMLERLKTPTTERSR